MIENFSIIKTLDLDKLDNMIDKYICMTNRRDPYIFMSDDTCNAIADAVSPFKSNMFSTKENLNTKCKNGVNALYTGYKVFINNDLKFGMVEIR